MLGWDQISLWEVPGHSQAQVFLPNQDSVKQVLQDAIDTIMTPKPLTNQVQTLEAQLTAAHQATTTSIPTLTPILTPTSTPTPLTTLTPIGETPSPMPTPTLPGYP